jgi:hypothetical protein
MSAGWILVAAFLVLLVILPAILGLVIEGLRANRSRAPVLLSADTARARATLAYYNEVHDSHSG